MSKIIEALEKAKREGRLENTAVALEERDHVVPLRPEGAETPANHQVRRRSRSYLPAMPPLDARLLAGIDPRVEVLHRPMSVASEQYRQLRSRLERVDLKGEVQTLAITSAGQGEGKSLTAVNLALVMAQNANREVLLIDADFRRPNIHRLLGIDLVPGLSNYLEGDATQETIVRELPFHGLSVVTAGSPKAHPGELLASPEFADFVAWSRINYDYVLLDTPPMQPISDVSFLSEFVTGVLLVVRAGKTGKDAVKKAVERLPAGKVIGTLLNRADDLGNGHGYGYGYKKGEYGYSGGYS